MIAKAPVRSGELHYPRIPCAYWRHRLQMARAMGLNAISTYTFWNAHERSPGAYDFAAELDVASFVRIAQDEGLEVILRPGPYVCAEWDFGGLPAWLLRDGPLSIRSADPAYMEPVRRWLKRLGEQLAPLQSRFGGPIIAVQLENEYGAFGNDRTYLRALRDALADAGFDAATFYTIDQPKDLAAGSLDELPFAATFGPGEIENNFARLRELRADAPLLCGEYWAGWFDHWGEQHHRLDDDAQVRELEWMLQKNASFNIYMFHGGTNFGFWNGANSSQAEPYQPTTTSYDYDAALDEAGRPTAKFQRFRQSIARITGCVPPPVPDSPPLISVAPFALEKSCALLQSELGAGNVSRDPVSMEALRQDLGYVLYRTVVREPGDAVLDLQEVRDYAVIAIDGLAVARLDRRLGERCVPIRTARANARLDVLVENGGRINYGADLPFERKGLVKPVLLGGAELHDWQAWPLRFDDLERFAFCEFFSAAPAMHRGVMHVDEPGDLFLDVSTLQKGALFVNGRCAGRFWAIGPQRALYVPAAWLVRGNNMVTALDLFPHKRPPVLRSA